MFERIGGRKLSFGLFILAIGLGIGLTKGDIPPNILTLLEFIFGAFVTGNSIGTIAGVVAETRGPGEEVSSTETVDLTPILQSVEELKQTDIAMAQSISLVQQSLTMIIRKYGIDRLPDPR